MADKDSNIFINFLKLFSGRVLLTIICGIAFIMLTKTLCNILMEKSSEITFENLNGILNMILLIISNIVTFYFSKDSNKKKTTDNDEWQVSIKKTK